MLAESGLNVTGLGFAKANYINNQTFPLEWAYNKEDEELIIKLYKLLNPIQACLNAAVRKNFGKGHVRIHLAGYTVSDGQGRVVFE